MESHKFKLVGFFCLDYELYNIFKQLCNKNYNNIGQFYIRLKTQIMKKVINLCFIAVAMISCNSQAKQEAAIMQAKQEVIDSIVKVDNNKKNEDIRKHIIDSLNDVPATKQHQEKVVVHKTYSDGTNTTNTTTTTVTKQKKGWSNKAKGAVIGAGVGAVTGAMVDKKKGEGAIVGGLLGAGAGLGVGAILDAKEKKQSKQ